MVKKLAIAYSLDKTIYAILRRRSNGYIYNAATGASEALGTWNNTRKAECAVALTDQGGGYYIADFPAGCEEGVWDAFYFGQIGDEIDINDRLIGRDKFINGSVTAEENSKLAVGHSPDKTIYAILRFKTNAYVWNETGEALEPLGTWNNARKVECAITLTDKGGGYYTADFPSSCTTVGTYHSFYYEKLGDDIDISDRLIGRGKIAWYGSGAEAEITPTGNRGLAMVNLRDLVAASEGFQAGVGAEDAEEAKEHLHITAYTPETGAFERPFGLICRTETDKDEAVAVDDSINGGDLELRFEQDIPADYKDKPKNAEIYFLNWVEAVLADMWVLSRQGGSFAMNNIDTIEGPTQYESDEAGSFINGIRLMINWGLTS